MSKAEEKALKIYPAERGHMHDRPYQREGFIVGYHQAETDLTDKAKVSSGWDGFYYGQGYKQAEKDLELTWEDIKVIEKLLGFDNIIESPKEFYQEVLKRFKNLKK